MCEDCFDEDEIAGDGHAPEQLARAARHIEADMAGEPVPAEAWDIYFGRATGPVDWRSIERMARCIEAAQVLLAMNER